MTVEVKAETTVQVAEEVVVVTEKLVEESKCEKVVEKCSSYREESNFLTDLKESEKKALIELKTKLEKAILENTIFEKKEKKECIEKETEKKEECVEEEKSEETPIVCVKTKETVEIDTDISIWGVPLLPSKANEATNVVLLKFLRAREFKVNEAFEMLRKTLQWRKDFKIESILDEEFCADLASAAYMSGNDREKRPVCYNIFGVLEKEGVFEKMLVTEEKREQFLRWRVQLIEKGIKELDFKPCGISSLVQVNDLKNFSSKKDVRSAVNKAIELLQDNYPEFVAKNIFVNVPFWYFAFHSILSPFLTERSRSKLVFARPSKVTDALLKYIPIHEIPIQYGGIKRENDFEFSTTDGEATELILKAGATQTIEIPTPEAGTTFIWDLVVLGWEVNYTEEFVPSNEDSYTMIIQKERKICSNEEPIRNTFKNHESGKIALTIHNCSGKKKKAYYRFKVNKACF